MKSPSLVRRWRFLAMNRSCTSGGRLVDSATGQRSWALLLTLFTFCPPGPPLREKVNENSASGTRMSRVTARNFLSEMGATRSASFCGPPGVELVFSVPNTQYDFANRLPTEEYVEGLGGSIQREHSRNARFNLPSTKQFKQFLIILSTKLGLSLSECPPKYSHDLASLEEGQIGRIF